MPMSFDDIETFVTELPNVQIGVSWGNRTYTVGDKGFAWQRPLSKADLKRFGSETPPKGEILAVRVESLDAKDAFLAMDLPGFFTIAHFDGYPAILIELRKARAKDIRAALVEAHRGMAAAAASTGVPKRKRAGARTKPRSAPRRKRSG